MTTMIEDAVSQLKAGIDQQRAAKRREYGSRETVVVRSTSWSRGHERTTWSEGVITAAAWNGRSWFYRIRFTDARGLHSYTVVGRGAIRKA